MPASFAVPVPCQTKPHWTLSVREYTPAIVDGKAMAVLFAVDVNFHLR